ncbi:MAG TPA: glycosyltransferase family 87 protein [Candidatus Dormibacteraeota bacterium]|nr:glycosyltransferase family 87 protein [Candidatus Dormibacteraeota bacterium]
MTFLTRAQRLALFAAVFGSVLLCAGQLFLWARAFTANPLDQDFTLWYAAARVGLTDGWNHLYDADRQEQMIRQLQHVNGALSPLSVYISPPPLAWLAAPFTLVPPTPAYLVWTAISVVALVGAWRLVAPRPVKWPWLYALPLLAWFPVFIGLVLGQPVAFVMLSVAAAAWLAQRNRKFAAGVVLSLTLLKPQLALLVGPTLLFGGEMVFASGWLTGTAVLIGLSVGLVGVVGIEHGLELVRKVQVYPYNSYLTLAYIADPVVRSGYLSPSARLVGINPLTLSLQVVAGVSALAIAFHNRGRGAAIVLSIGIIGSILVAPHLHQDDLAILVVAAWLLAGTRPERVLQFWPLIVLVAGESPQFLTPLPIEASLVAWLLLLWRKHNSRDAAADTKTPVGAYAAASSRAK